MSVTFTGDMVGTVRSVREAEDDDSTAITTGPSPFLTTDIVRVTFSDNSFDSVGEFRGEGPIRILSVQVTRDGVTYDLSVGGAGRVLDSDEGDSELQGDTFFVTQDAIGPASSGPFSSFTADQFVFSSENALAANRTTIVPQQIAGGNANFDGDGGVPCFARSTKIFTTKGEMCIEDLREGDNVLTLDHGYRPIRWIGSRYLDGTDLSARPKLRPVRIEAGALGRGLPLVSLYVSPQHRVLVNSRIAERVFGYREALVAAIKLVGLPGISIVEDCEEVEYFHMLFDQHEVVWSNGAPTESLYTGPQALKALLPEAYAEIAALFPQIMEEGFRPTPARHLPEKGQQTKNFVARHIKNNKQILESFAGA